MNWADGGQKYSRLLFKHGDNPCLECGKNKTVKPFGATRLIFARTAPESIFDKLAKLLRGGLQLIQPIDATGRRYTLSRFRRDRKSTRLNSSHVANSYAVFCLKKK